MIDFIKHSINFLSAPEIIFPALAVGFFFVFPPNNWFERWNERLGINKLWTPKGGLLMLLGFVGFLGFGMTDANFRLIVMKPDNLPIVGLLFLSLFFLWLSMYQAMINDARLADNQKPREADDSEKVLVWPDLVFIEFIALIICTICLLVWAVELPAPLEEAANPAESPNPSKAPWYFLALQEMLVYFDPWLAGVVFPTLIVVGLIAIPYLDINPKGAGFYCYRDRKMSLSIFLFGWLIMWVYLIVVGTFLRGPNWNFFGPFEWWDPHKLEALTNVNLSEYVYMIWLGTGLPQNILLREIFGFLIIGGYFMVLPPLLAKTWFKGLFEKMGVIRYSIFVSLLLCSLSLPIKMLLRWLINLKYIVAIPEYFFNI